VRRFASAKALTAFLGGAPKQRTSGTSLKRRTMISRTGSPALRAALFMPSLVAKKHKPILNTFAELLLSNGMARRAVILAVMHKLTHLLYGVIYNEAPFDANYLAKRLAIQDGI
jgi:transposase